MGYEKVYVAMYLYVDADGKVKPAVLEWKDGKRYKIDRVLDERISPPLHTGGVLTKRFCVSIMGREKVIYLEKHSNRWFVEKPLY